MWNSSGRAASSTTNGISGSLAPSSQALLAPLSRRIYVFALIRGWRAAKPAALTPGYDSWRRSAAPAPRGGAKCRNSGRSLKAALPMWCRLEAGDTPWPFIAIGGPQAHGAIPGESVHGLAARARCLRRLKPLVCLSAMAATGQRW